MKKNISIIMAVLLLLFSGCSILESDKNEEWPETGKVSVKIKTIPTLIDDSFEFTWFYGENGDGDVFASLADGSTFSFESPVVRRGLGGHSMFIKIEPEKIYSETEM
ncbi:hypothetical protein [Negadavirga shengliensis]|uniref:Chagasin family peptidase inhibitor I42 n=1 Tax=Negadavirga shengliensis TaxID=1389218 RepID=A0ABV9T0L9_9BACT